LLWFSTCLFIWLLCTQIASISTLECFSVESECVFAIRTAYYGSKCKTCEWFFEQILKRFAIPVSLVGSRVEIAVEFLRNFLCLRKKLVTLSVVLVMYAWYWSTKKMQTLCLHFYFWCAVCDKRLRSTTLHDDYLF